MKEEEKCHQQKYKGWNTICLKNTLHKKVPRKKLLWNRNHLLNETMMMNIESIIIGIDTESQWRDSCHIILYQYHQMTENQLLLKHKLWRHKEVRFWEAYQ